MTDVELSLVLASEPLSGVTVNVSVFERPESALARNRKLAGSEVTRQVAPPPAVWVHRLPSIVSPEPFPPLDWTVSVAVAPEPSPVMRTSIA